MAGLTLKLNSKTMQYEIVQPQKAEVINLEELKKRRTNSSNTAKNKR